MSEERKRNGVPIPSEKTQERKYPENLVSILNRNSYILIRWLGGIFVGAKGSTV
jgi:hypothetical protein